MSSEDPQYVIGVDVGGTNTDTAILHIGKVIGFAKCSTTVEKTEGVINSIQAALYSLSEDTQKHLLSSDNIRVAIGTTYFTNAVTERDESNLTRVAVIRLCGSSSRSLPPFSDFPEELAKIIHGGSYLVEGGMEYDTREISSISETEIRQCVASSLTQDPPVKNFVICGVFSPCATAENNQEIKAAAIVRDECQRRGVECSYTLSHELGMLGLLERENAAVLNESLKSLASVTINAFGQALFQLKLCSSTKDFYLTQNDGTLISAQDAKSLPVLTYSSGPTNSMRGAAYLTSTLNAIVVDIGGTTSDVGVLVNGFPRQASVHCEVGGVKTNFPMPDVCSIGLGGGSIVTFDPQNGSATVGPKSVGYEIVTKSLCFGGDTCTATDVAMAAGVAPTDFCTQPEAVKALGSELVGAAMNEMRRMLETVIDSMKTENKDCTLVMVGGGSILVDKNTPIKGVSSIERPSEHFGVANAVGAALGTVGGLSDRIVNLGPIREQLMSNDSSLGRDAADRRARTVAVERGRELAIEEVKKKGGLPDTIYIHSEEATDVTYVMDRVRVKVKAIGSLTRDSRTAAPSHIPSSLPPTDGTILGLDSGGAATKYTPRVLEPVCDNPSWPHSSEEELEKDVRAGLPTPTVDRKAGVWTLCEHDIICLATGAAILGCGGGGSPYTGQLRAMQLIRSGKSIKIANPFRVNGKSGLVCGVAFMGAPAILIEKLPGGQETSLGLQAVKRVLASGVCDGVESGRVSYGGVEVEERTFPWIDGTQFTSWLAKHESLENVDMSAVSKELQVTGIICLEAGGLNSIEPLLVGALEDLPVFDVDGMGRAFPELQMFVPFINGSRHTPSALADNKGETITCTNIESSKDLENFFRVETVRMGLSAGITSGVMSYDEMMSKSILFTMSQAWQLGRAVFRARSTHTNVIQAVVDMQHGLALLIGKVVSVQRKTSGGFTLSEAVIEGLDDHSGRQLRVLAKNENYIAQRVYDGVPQEILACTPDLITILDSDTGDAITTEMIRYGLRVGVVVLPANPRLKTEEVLKVVGPDCEAFGYDIPYLEPRPWPSQ